MDQIITRHRHELKRRTLTVRETGYLTPHMIRMVLHSEELADFTSLGADDHIKLIFPGTGETPEMREYTPRRFDTERCELVLDFAVHDAVPAIAVARMLRGVLNFPVRQALIRLGQLADALQTAGVIDTDGQAWHALAAGLNRTLPAARAKLVVFATRDLADETMRADFALLRARAASSTRPLRGGGGADLLCRAAGLCRTDDP